MSKLNNTPEYIVQVTTQGGLNRRTQPNKNSPLFVTAPAPNGSEFKAWGVLDVGTEKWVELVDGGFIRVAYNLNLSTPSWGAKLTPITDAPVSPILANLLRAHDEIEAAINAIKNG